MASKYNIIQIQKKKKKMITFLSLSLSLSHSLSFSESAYPHPLDTSIPPLSTKMLGGGGVKGKGEYSGYLWPVLKSREGFFLMLV